jgi:hypothetical protein
VWVVATVRFFIYVSLKKSFELFPSFKTLLLCKFHFHQRTQWGAMQIKQNKTKEMQKMTRRGKTKIKKDFHGNATNLDFLRRS